MPSEHDSEILLRAEDLALGTTRTTECPVCRGGSSRERSFNVTRQYGQVAYLCHRASCGFRGYVIDHSTAMRAMPLRDDEPPSPYQGSIQPLDDDTVRTLAGKYEIPEARIRDCIKYAGQGWYALPVMGPDRIPRGWGLRWPWGAPNQPTPKFKLFLSTPDAISMAWYGLGSATGAVLVVEDQLSALRAAACAAVRAVALLGTDFSAVKVAELQRHAPGGIVLALDADATTKAFRMAQQWGPAFKQFRVAVLQQDVKDMPWTDLRHMLITQGVL